MKELHLPDNVKVHFAGGEVSLHHKICAALGVTYALYTCYPWVERKLFPKAKSPIVPQEWQKPDTARLIPKYICDKSLHVIQDSGLFTLMFGSQKDTPKDKKLIGRWYDGLVEYTIEHGQPVTCVEVDCQRVLGVDAAWEFREKMRRDLPNNRIINVFHLPDGQKGLDRLIEFSEYIAISVPELRFAGRKDYVPKIARYIKKRKPDIDIHLLGCTELSLLKECSFCTSADSTTWSCGNRYGFIDGKSIRTIDVEKVKALYSSEKWAEIAAGLSDWYAAGIVVQVEKLKPKYQRAAGNQDYYKLKP